MTTDRTEIDADGEDIAILKIEALDKDGRPVPTADNLLRFKAEGGVVIGVGNGNPNSLEQDVATERRAFNGLAQAIVRAGRGHALAEGAPGGHDHDVRPPVGGDQVFPAHPAEDPDGAAQAAAADGPLQLLQVGPAPADLEGEPPGGLALQAAVHQARISFDRWTLGMRPIVFAGRNDQ